MFVLLIKVTATLTCIIPMRKLVDLLLLLCITA